MLASHRRRFVLLVDSATTERHDIGDILGASTTFCQSRCHKFQRRLAAARCDDDAREWVNSVVIRFGLVVSLSLCRYGGNVRKSEVFEFTS